MRSALLSLLLWLSGLGLAQAMEDAQPPLVVDVYPRREGEGGSDRAEALSRRMQRADGAFRAICTGCGRGLSETGGLFYPYQVLNAPPPAAERGPGQGRPEAAEP